MSFDFTFDLLRLSSAFFCGALLSLSGSFTQLVSENDLASPSTFGFDAFAILLVMLSYLSYSFTPSLSASFIMGLIIFSTFIFGFRKLFVKIKSIAIKDLILIGLAFNLLIGALFSVIQFLLIAINFQFPSTIWFGGFRFASIESLIGLIILFICSYLYTFIARRELQLLSISKSFCLSQGIKTYQTSVISILIGLIITIYIVFNFGVFSFLALVLPHMLRQVNFFKYSFKNEIIYGPLLSGMFLMILDFFTLSFSILGAEIPTGMLSSIMGTVIFIILLLKTQYKHFAKY